MLLNSLVAVLNSFLPEDPYRGVPAAARMTFRAIAKEFGIKKWGSPRSKFTSVSRLLKLAREADILEEVVVRIVKRGVRLRRSRGVRVREHCCRGLEPIWREDVEKIRHILAQLGRSHCELNDPRFLQGLPWRARIYTDLTLTPSYGTVLHA